MQNYPIDMSMKPDVEAFFDAVTNTISYVISDPKTKACAVVDSVMDIDYASGRITQEKTLMSAPKKASPSLMQAILQPNEHAMSRSSPPR